MMEMSSADPMVATCHVLECSYNEGDCCHAPDIQVGDDHPMCDTFTTSGVVNLSPTEGRVAGCLVAHCHFNESMSCSAPGITVNHHAQHADCETFRAQ